MAANILPTPEQLREILRYEPETGKLFWLPRPPSMFEGGKYPAERLAGFWNSKYAGQVAGAPNGFGYLRIHVGNQRILAYRVAWAMYYGYWPDAFIDHIDCDRMGNRIANLRLASKSQNGFNRHPPSNNVSGHKGVSWHKAGRKWQVKLTLDGKQIYLGLFSDLSDAVEARLEAIRSHAGQFGRG